MKHAYNIKRLLKVSAFMLSLAMLGVQAQAQDDSTATEEKAAPAKKYVKNTFESAWIIDNQTVMVPIKGTFEMDILHRFGTVEKGYKDFFGFFANSNIRLGFSYSPINDLMVGVSITKSNMVWEGYAKYAILRQTKGNEYPVSVTYFGDVAYESRTKEYYINSSDRFSYFHQLIVARKINDKISVQAAPSLTHVNVVQGYFSDSAKISQERKHNHFALSVAGHFKIKEGMALIFNYDQPLTKHNTGNPKPNLAIGLQMTTSSHAFQVFLGNYYFITPQRNNYFNQNKGLLLDEGTLHRQFLIGFNITRLWNY